MTRLRAHLGMGLAVVCVGEASRPSKRERARAGPASQGVPERAFSAGARARTMCVKSSARGGVSHPAAGGGRGPICWGGRRRGAGRGRPCASRSPAPGPGSCPPAPAAAAAAATTTAIPIVALTHTQTHSLPLSGTHARAPARPVRGALLRGTRRRRTARGSEGGWKGGGGHLAEADRRLGRVADTELDKLRKWTETI